MSDSDSDSMIDYNDETKQNPIDPECIRHVDAMKRCLHRATVKGPLINTKEAQSNKRVIEYMRYLRRLHDIIVNQIKKTHTVPPLTEFPCQATVQAGLEYINQLYQANRFSANIAYDDFFTTQLKTHPNTFIISSKNILE
jgi:hypothetical protein